MNEIEKWGNDLVKSIKDTLNEYTPDMARRCLST